MLTLDSSHSSGSRTCCRWAVSLQSSFAIVIGRYVTLIIQVCGMFVSPPICRNIHGATGRWCAGVVTELSSKHLMFHFQICHICLDDLRHARILRVQGFLSIRHQPSISTTHCSVDPLTENSVLSNRHCLSSRGFPKCPADFILRVVIRLNLMPHRIPCLSSPWWASLVASLNVDLRMSDNPLAE